MFTMSSQVFGENNFQTNGATAPRPETATSRARLALLIFWVSSGESEGRPNGEDLERREGCPEC